MATINQGSIIQSRFIGSPIVVPVTASSPAGNVTFHRVRLKVTVGDGGGVVPSNDAQFEFSIPCSKNGETVWFDISSAFRAFADTYNPMPTSFSYPRLAATMEAVEDYMIDGVSYEGQSSSGTATVSGKYMGALSDKDRGFGVSGSWSEPSRYSRKPTTSPQIAYTGKSLLVAGATGTSAPSVSSHTVADGANDGYNCYGIMEPADGHEIRFINTLGVHENVFVAGLPTREVSITTDKYTIARQETLTKFSRAIAVKYGDRETWTFSSGPLDEAWVSWYIHEFLMASWVWMDINNIWIPCHVLPEEQVTLVQHDKTDMLEVMLALKLDINGSPL